jgi:GDP-L-fucose synthase
MKKDSRIFVAGHNGLVGSALVRCLEREGYSNIYTRSFESLDLRNRDVLDSYFKEISPEYIFLAAARVGGIQANIDLCAEFIHDNLMIACNGIDAAYRFGVKKLLFLGSSCIYPKLCPQPMREEYLMSGTLEPTNEYYALAKIAGLKMCEAYNKQYGTDFISCMPTNLYGPNDNFDEKTSHVIPGLIARFVRARREGAQEIYLWGSGRARREFLHVDDCARALVFLMNNYSGNSTINIGSGADQTIEELAYLIARITGFKGAIKFDISKPEGTPQKLLNVEKINALGWHAKASLEQGIVETVEWYEKNYEDRGVCSLRPSTMQKQTHIG